MRTKLLLAALGELICAMQLRLPRQVASVHLRRKALFGNQWLRTSESSWPEETTAGFSRDSTGCADRSERFMEGESGRFFLSQCGFVAGFTRYGEKFTRPAVGQPPGDLKLLALPQ